MITEYRCTKDRGDSDLQCQASACAEFLQVNPETAVEYEVVHPPQRITMGTPQSHILDADGVMLRLLLTD